MCKKNYRNEHRIALDAPSFLPSVTTNYVDDFVNLHITTYSAIAVTVRWYASRTASPVSINQTENKSRRALAYTLKGFTTIPASAPATKSVALGKIPKNGVRRFKGEHNFSDIRVYSRA